MYVIQIRLPAYLLTPSCFGDGHEEEEDVSLMKKSKIRPPAPWPGRCQPGKQERKEPIHITVLSRQFFCGFLWVWSPPPVLSNGPAW